MFGETSIRNPCFFPYHHPLFYLLNPNSSPLGSVSVHLLFKPEMNQVKNSIGPSGKATEYFGGYYYHWSFPWSDLHHGTTNSWISTKYQCNLGGIFFMVLKLLGAYWLLQAPLSPVFHWNRAGLIQSQFCSHQQSSNSCIFEGKLGWRGKLYLICIRSLTQTGALHNLMKQYDGTGNQRMWTRIKHQDEDKPTQLKEHNLVLLTHDCSASQ